MLHAAIVSREFGILCVVGTKNASKILKDGDNMIFTVSATDRYADTNIENFQVNTRRNSGDSLIENGGTQEWGTGGATSDTFIADNTYDGAQTTYDAEFEVLTDSGFCCTSGAEKWTAVAASSALYKAANTAEKSTLFVADPRVYFSLDGTTATDNVTSTYSVYNRGEIATSTFYLLNSRTEKLGRAMNISAVNSGSTVESGPTSVTPSSNLYTFAYTIGASDTAVADTTGSLKKLRAANTDQTKDSNNVFGASSLYYIDAHPQLNNTTASKDDFPTEDANETKVGVIAADTFSFFGHIKNVRKDTNIDTSGSAVVLTLKKPDGTTRTTFTTDTGSDGWTGNSDFSLEAPGVSWSLVASSTFNGNSGIDTESLTFVSPYSGKFRVDTVGWNQTYSIGNTARFTLRTMEVDSASIFQATAADSAPSYDLRYWDGATWQILASGTMTALAATATYETTYAIPNDSAWIGRKVIFFVNAKISGTDVNLSHEIEIVGSPAQVVINSVTDTTLPTISANIRITNEGTAAFEYTYEYCIVTSDVNQCGGGDDVAYGSAAKLIQAGANFDTTLTLNVTAAGNYFYKTAVWWSNQSSKASRSFTATADTSMGSGSAASSGGGGGSIIPTQSSSESQSTFAAVWQKISEILSRLLGLETRMGDIEARVTALERQLNQRVSLLVPQQEIYVPQPSTSKPKVKVEAPAKPFFKIRLQ